MRMDVPLSSDHASRFLPWLVALLVYLAALALAGTMALGAAVDRWNRELVGTLTVQVGGPGGGEALKPADLDKQTERAVEVIRRFQGVAAARVLTQEEIGRLLAPWLGEGANLTELPLPRLIDVTLAPDATIDAVALKRELAAVAQGVSVEDHRVWLSNLARLARAIEGVSLGLIAFVGFVGITGVIFVTRTGLALHRDTIEVLHLIGAKDGYIARQFERHAMRLCLKGGIPAAALAAATVAGLDHAGRALGPALLPTLALDWRQWLALLAVPLAATLIAMITAHLAVLRSLARQP